ncbi:AfsR/SARP family transcriptional regulator [Plantactinospora sp. WMMB334]|uniref:AfsR/SARP family transcriptional regulator n=1 Tax=Plantactinospora sp. WMMB334 TaxID=3404119 RepID=UPI003B963B39
MRWKILGPVDVEEGGRSIPVPRPQQQAVLAYLVLNANLAVSTGQLIDALWGGAAPSTARTHVQVLISRIRRILRGADARDILVSQAGGYRLVVDDGDGIDEVDFSDQLTRARAAVAAGRLPSAVERYEAALDLWRGPALHGAAGAFVESAAARLEEQRLVAREELIDVRLTLGRHAALIGELRELRDVHPLRERFVGQLMLALYRCGRRAEALGVFRTFNTALRDEHGLEASVRLAELHQAILRADPAPQPASRGASREVPPSSPTPAPRAVAAPAQLPGDVAGFTGRAGQLRRLEAFLPQWDGEPAAGVSIVVLTGSAGIGKTAMAVHWAHQVRHRFPDGQLHVNLRGYAANAPLRPIDALARFLHTLGVPAEQVPAEVDEAAAMYRGRLADRRMLVLLDNANHPDQVRPLLPGGSGCMVLITSRDRLGGLVARDGAQQVVLDLLTPVESVALLTRVLGTERVAAEPDEVARLADLCGHLPLALRIAAAHLIGRPRRRVGDLVAELCAGDRLAVLQVAGDEQAAVRAAFDLSYDALSVDDRRTFRLLGLVPGVDFTASAAAALADVAVERADRMLDRLANAHLVDQHADGRYALHDLLRIYAQDRVRNEEVPVRREAARQRLLDYYLYTAHSAAQLLYPQLLRLSCPAEPPPQNVPPLTGQPQALEWLDAERANLVAAVSHAADQGPYEAAWTLSDALRGYFFFRMYTVDWLTVASTGLAAAEAGGNLRAQASSHLSLGGLFWRQGDYTRALDRFSKALAIAERDGWEAGQGSALTTLGISYTELGQTRQALRHLTRAVELARRSSWQGGQQVALINLGFAYLNLGQLDRAERHTREALALSLEIGSRDGRANCLKNLGLLHYLRGRFDEAIEHLTQALSLYREIGNRGAEAITLRSIATVQRDSGRPEEAMELAQMALSLARSIGSRRYEGLALGTVGTIHRHLGGLPEAVDSHQQALELALLTGNRDSQLETLVGLAATLAEAGRHEQALSQALQALDLARRIGTRLLEGDALAVLADIRLRMGEPGAALGQAQAAVAIHRETGYRVGDARAQILVAYALRATRKPPSAAAHWREAHALLRHAGAAELAPAATLALHHRRAAPVAVPISADPGRPGSTAPAPAVPVALRPGSPPGDLRFWTLPGPLRLDVVPLPTADEPGRAEGDQDQHQQQPQEGPVADE